MANLTHAQVLKSLKSANTALMQMQKRHSDAIPAGDRKRAFPDLTETIDWYGQNKALFQTQSRGSGNTAPGKGTKRAAPASRKRAKA
jgi:hypothetical protein